MLEKSSNIKKKYTNTEYIGFKLSNDKDCRIIDLLNETEGRSTTDKIKKLLRKAGGIPEPEEHNVALNRGVRK